MSDPVVDIGSETVSPTLTVTSATVAGSENFPRPVSVTERFPYLARANAFGDVCAACGRSLGPKDTVYLDGMGGKFALVCNECASLAVRGYQPLAPCDGCGRLVGGFVAPRGGRRYCSHRCRNLASARRRREARWLARKGRLCAVCGRVFVPLRCDARYCSPGCRQRAYRQRLKKAKVTP